MIIAVPQNVNKSAEGPAERRRLSFADMGRFERFVVAVAISLAWLVLRLISPLLWQGDVRVRWRRVRTPIVEFQHPETQARVVLIGTMHIADEAYWRRLRAEIGELEWKGATVCYERVKGPSEAEFATLPEDERAAYRLERRHGEQALKLFEQTGMVYQTRSLRYSTPEWVNTDVTWVVLLRALRMAGVWDREEFEGRMLEFLAGHPRTSVLAPWVFDRLLECFPALYTVTRWTNEFSTRRASKDPFIVDWRNDVAVQGIVDTTAKNPYVVSIWGAAHVPGIRDRLFSLGYEQVGRTRWLTARRLTFLPSIVLLLPRLLWAGKGGK